MATSSPARIDKKRGSKDSDSSFPKVEDLKLSEDDIKNASEENLTPENRQGLLKILGNAIGFDVTAITLPVNLNEPVSFLTRLCEGIQYSELLDKAALCETPSQRLLYLSIFAVTFYTSAERIGKPFNPLLGETYELSDDNRGNFRFIAEQVSHHPPVGACHAETDLWKFWQSQCLKTKFAGNSLDCSVVGSNYVYFKDTKETYKWKAVKTAVNNIIVGKLWLDHYGDVEIVNKTTNEVAKVHLKQCGWFSSGWHEVDGEICDSRGVPSITIHGKWNESIFVKLLNPSLLQTSYSNPNSLPDSPADTRTPPVNGLNKKEEKKLKKKLKKEEKNQEKERKKDIKEFKRQIKKQLVSDDPIWTHTIKPLDISKLPSGAKYMNDWTSHTLYLCEMSDTLKAILPPTDSRLRPDRLALEKGDVKKAAAEKHALEERQREDRKKKRKSKERLESKIFQDF